MKIITDYNKTLYNLQERKFQWETAGQLLCLQSVIVSCILRQIVVRIIKMVWVSFERKNLFQISNISFYCDKFSSSYPNLRAGGRYKYQLILPTDDGHLNLKLIKIIITGQIQTIGVHQFLILKKWNRVQNLLLIRLIQSVQICVLVILWLHILYIKWIIYFKDVF